MHPKVYRVLSILCLFFGINAVAGVRQTQFTFEGPEGWWFGNGAGLDFNKGLAHKGFGNGWVRHTHGWDAINNWVNVEPGAECTAFAWLRSSDTLTDGYMSIRGLRRDGSVGDVINETKLIGIGIPVPGHSGYYPRSFTFNSGSNSRVLFYVGLWGNGQDSWIQIDDVVISCPTPY